MGAREAQQGALEALWAPGESIWEEEANEREEEERAVVGVVSGLVGGGQVRGRQWP